MPKTYTSKDIKTLDGIEAIRLRPSMYIGTVDSEGLHHILLEAISNSIDEALNGYGNEIFITIDSKTNRATVGDFGRGIPFGKTDKGTEALKDIATSLHSGGKFGQGGYSVSGGLHGIGITAINALSSSFEIESTRDGKIAHLKAKEGTITDYTVKDLVPAGIKDKANDHGTMIIFTPDPKIFGKTKFELEKIQQQLQLLSYLSVGIKFHLRFDDQKFEYLSKEGIKDLIADKTRGEKTITDIAYIDTEIDDIRVEIAIQFGHNGRDRTYAFTNNIPNRDGGTHVTGFRSALTSLINQKAREYELLTPAEDNFTGEMVRRGIYAAISIKMKETPMFTNQTKDKLQSPSARAAVSQALGMMDIPRKDITAIIKKALTEKRAEDAAKRAREAARKVVSGGRSLNMLKDLPENLKDCNSDNGELFIVEGNSAAGSAESGRDPQTQAILPLRGKVLNTHDKELAEIIENKEIKDILTSLGAGIGDRFNIRNLRYDKIILLADADIDGGHINVLLMTFFLKHLPQLIEAGKVYRAIPPLYKVKQGSKHIYIQDDAELEKYTKRHGQPKDITRFKGLGEMNPEQLWDTTLNPETRTLVQLTTSDMAKTLELFDTLMGKSSAARREYIMKNAGELI